MPGIGLDFAIPSSVPDHRTDSILLKVLDEALEKTTSARLKTRDDDLIR
jgi:hypothetical protein